MRNVKLLLGCQCRISILCVSALLCPKTEFGFLNDLLSEVDAFFSLNFGQLNYCSLDQALKGRILLFILMTL